MGGWTYQMTAIVILSTSIVSERAHAGGLWFRRHCEQCDEGQSEGACKACCRPRHHCCLCPPEAPRGEVAFALPAVARDGQAFRISEEAFARAVRKAAAETARDTESTESAVKGGTVEGRLTKLEDDVHKLQGMMDRLTVAVERLAEQKPQAATK